MPCAIFNNRLAAYLISGWSKLNLHHRSLSSPLSKLNCSYITNPSLNLRCYLFITLQFISQKLGYALTNRILKSVSRFQLRSTSAKMIFTFYYFLAYRYASKICGKMKFSQGPANRNIMEGALKVELYDSGRSSMEFVRLSNNRRLSTLENNYRKVTQVCINLRCYVPRSRIYANRINYI